MSILKCKKSVFILTLCLNVAPLMAMDALDNGHSSHTMAAHSGISMGGAAVEAVAIDEDAREKECLIAELAGEVDEDGRESLNECSLKQLRNLNAAFSLMPSAAFNSVLSDYEELSSKSYYLMGFAAYQGANWNGNVSRLLENGLNDRVADLCTILYWAAEGLDVFTEQTLVITAFLDIDKKVAVMKALSPRIPELKNVGYVAELQRKINESFCIVDVPAMIEETRRKFFAAARDKFERLQTK